jgi:hypothetical protein
MLQLPAWLVEEARRGRVVLFLGAGASIGARKPSGQSAPDGPQLRDQLCDRFLGGRYKNESLAWVAELAISEADLSTVQDFIADLFRDLEPADFHLLMPTFKWRGLVTTNYDRVVERSYERVPDAVQTLAAFLSDRDRISDRLRSERHLPILKLHGCVTRTHDPDLPLILTADLSVSALVDGDAYKEVEVRSMAFPVSVSRSLYRGAGNGNAAQRMRL